MCRDPVKQLLVETAESKGMTATTNLVVLRVPFMCIGGIFKPLLIFWDSEEIYALFAFRYLCKCIAMVV